MNIEITEYRNPKYNADGNIDVEIKHPEEGWIPYTLDMDDPDSTIDNAELKKLVDKMDIAKCDIVDDTVNDDEYKSILAKL